MDIGRILLMSVGCLQAFASADGSLKTSNCGVAATWSFLTALDVEVSQNAVHERFRPIASSTETTSLLEIRQVVSSFGIAVESRRFQQSQLEALPAPSVVFLRDRAFEEHETGHFVTLLRHEQNAVVIADWKSPSGVYVVRVPNAVIQRDWTGLALVPMTKTPAQVWGFWVFAAIATIVPLAYLRRWWRRRATKFNRRLFVELPIVTLGTMSLALIGCSNESGKPNALPLLRFENPSLQLGRVTVGERVACRFPFCVRHEGPVRIKAVTSSCGCTVVTNDVVDRQFAADERAEIVLEYSVPAVPGTQSAFARIETDPPSDSPIVIAIHGSPKLPPVSSVQTLQLEAQPLQRVTGKITFTHRHGVAEPALTMLREQSAAGDLTIDDVQRETAVVVTNVVTGERECVDKITIALKSSTAFPYGDHRGMIHVKWSDASVTEIPWIVRVALPFEFSSRHLFVGIVRPGESWARRLRLRQGSSVAEVARFEIAGVDALVKSGTSDELAITGTAPQQVGRFSGNLVVHFKDSAISPFRLPLSGMVKDSP